MQSTIVFNDIEINRSKLFARTQFHDSVGRETWCELFLLRKQYERHLPPSTITSFQFHGKLRLRHFRHECRRSMFQFQIKCCHVVC